MKAVFSVSLGQLPQQHLLGLLAKNILKNYLLMNFKFIHFIHFSLYIYSQKSIQSGFQNAVSVLGQSALFNSKAKSIC